MIYVSLYLVSIVLANLSAAYFGPSATIVNAFLFIGLDLTCRDRLHDAWHRRGLLWKMGLLLVVGGGISYLGSPSAGMIALASCSAFMASAAVDALVYHMLRNKSRFVRINGSNVFGAAVDSLLFPTIAFGGLLPEIVVGQFLAKTLGGWAWSLVLARRVGQPSPVRE